MVAADLVTFKDAEVAKVKASGSQKLNTSQAMLVALQEIKELLDTNNSLLNDIKTNTAK